ncbi:C40 family peptidase [Paenibacillus sp. AGC30]
MSGKIEAIIADAKRLLGVRFRWGSKSYHISKRFDCSSFTQYLFQKQGVLLARTVREQAKQGSSVPRSRIKKGDLLFFAVPGRFSSDDIPGHVGLYIGRNKMIHCIPYPRNKVIISDLNQPYWAPLFLCARRMFGRKGE